MCLACQVALDNSGFFMHGVRGCSRYTVLRNLRFSEDDSNIDNKKGKHQKAISFVNQPKMNVGTTFIS